MADLHRHLDGSLRLATVEQLAEELGLPVPSPLVFHVGMGLQEALARFAFTLSLLQDPTVVRRVASEICEDAQSEGVSTLEIRFAPQLHHKAPMAAVVDAALEGIHGRAGLVLCALYGEDPEVAKGLVEIAASREGVVGLDLAGAPLPQHRYRLGDYAPAFRAAREIGIGRTVHAGEGRAPEEILVAIEQLGAQRIGHGTTLLEAPRVVDSVLANHITLEACITSNLQTGAIEAIHEHPLPQWLKLGISACVCTDNTLFSDVTAVTEHEVAQRIPGMTAELLDRAVENGHRAAFAGR
ncbi:MAG: hypothetical protein A2289_22295 [Deltaproteobacteria bacterium RIFOXYA12_FULL_58_15]|nr:MAG: hypothetical protein A2289_22295 [Deltaproteobacteria bacterium RIFOXYA12_FULL_58_15]OGR07398.1 MAG: hypothetical protein A2341_26290 [Deltaproteobacteria bacterium RIFOXYB12_FULL_58_9]